MRRGLVVLAALVVVRCSLSSGVDSHEYACVSDNDCVEGFRCDAHVCTRGGAGGGAAGGDAGGAAGGDAGGAAGGDAGGAAGGTAGGAAGGTAGGAAGGTAGGAAGGTAGGAAGGTAGGAAGGTAGGAAGGTAGIGTPCTTGTQCSSTLCVDGYCCNTTCTAHCDACNVPTFEGQCRTAPLGSVPSPRCANDFACNGTTTACPTSCSSDAGCVNARCAADGVCLPKVSTLREDFNSGLDASVWSFVDPRMRVANGQLIAPNVPNSNAYPNIYAAHRYDLTDSEIRVELVDAGNQAVATFEAYAAAVCSSPVNNRCLAILANGGSVFVEKKDFNTYTTPFGNAPIGTWRFFRLRERAGTVYFEGSWDAGAWTTIGMGATPFIDELRDSNVWMGAGAYGAPDASTAATYDNLNVP